MSPLGQPPRTGFSRDPAPVGREIFELSARPRDPSARPPVKLLRVPLERHQAAPVCCYDFRQFRVAAEAAGPAVGSARLSVSQPPSGTHCAPLAGRSGPIVTASCRPSCNGACPESDGCQHSAPSRCPRVRSSGGGPSGLPPRPVPVSRRAAAGGASVAGGGRWRRAGSASGGTSAPSSGALTGRRPRATRSVGQRRARAPPPPPQRTRSSE